VVSKTLNLSGRALVVVLALVASQAVANAQAVRSQNGLTALDVQQQRAAAGTAAGPEVDFVNAQPMPLPLNPQSPDTVQGTIESLMNSPALGPNGGEDGSNGTGITKPLFLGTPAAQAPGVTPEDFGSNNHPFTTVRADLFSLNDNAVYPYRAAGKLFFKIGTSSYICSASLIKPGIVVTAAHCVANYGQRQFYSSWQFVPGYRNGAAPFGTWTAKTAYVLTAYYNGTDNCAVYGVVCPDDVALIVLNGTPGNNAGWFGYWYGGGYTSGGLFQITQLGYPAGLDNAAYMERTDSYGYRSSSNSNNTIIGSNMNGGSSGGPWLENFGLPSVLTGETNGSFTPQNVVVGVTSWGYTSPTPKEQGAAPFTSGNIQTLINSACAAYPGNC
jgi:V8-like Glu-specific endopeptidase